LVPLWRAALALISEPRCPLCGGTAPAGPAPPVPPPQLCAACLGRLALPQGGLQGDEPLLWCAAAAYEGPLRQLLLRQRPRPEPALIRALALEWHRCCQGVLPGAVLVPIPGWKRRGNPLPLLLAQALARWAGPSTRVQPGLLRRAHPTLGQHHLGRALRQRNQRGAFAAPAPVCSLGPPPPIWLVDDILTSGATALAAASALQASGHAVQGVLTLARTPARRRP
jgi:predicted amidophosphoribosyltransferase